MSRKEICIVAGNLPDIIYGSLEKLGFELLRMKKHLDLYDSISYHPDIVVHKINEKKLVLEKSTYQKYRNFFESRGIEVLEGRSILTSKYPKNIAYNVARIGNYAFHNLKYTDRLILDKLKEDRVKLVDINQGYSKCSMAIVNNNSFITSDRGIYKKAIELGFDVLLIRPGYIELEGQDYGFIGGATGLWENKLLIAGNLDKHPDGNRIRIFLESKGVKAISLIDSDLIDVGSIITI